MSEDKNCLEAFEALLNAGQRLSNVAYNLAQGKGSRLTEHDCEILDDCRKEWDAARSSAPVAQQADRIACLEKQNAELLMALREFADAAHLVLIAGGDYGDELSDRCLRDLLKEHRDKARALASCTPTATEAAAPKEPT